MNKGNQYSKPKISDSKAIELLSNGYSLEKIGKEYGLCPDSLSRRLKKLGYCVNNKQNERGLNHSIFELIDTEEKAYWLGFLYADGSIHSTKNIIELSLKPSDINHLEKFKLFIKANNKISLTKTRSRYCFSSKQIKQNLINLGCTPRKSETLRFPSTEQVPQSLQISFIRGYFDGDGCLTYRRKDNVLYPITGILGTQSILSNINSIINPMKIKTLTLANNKENASKHVFSLLFSAKETPMILEKLYSNASVYLDRKYNRFLMFKKNNYAVQGRNLLDYKDSKTVKAIIC